MAEHNASDHLLFGVLAFQNGCIDENQFLGAVRKWLKNKSVSLEQILVESKALSPKDREMLIPMVQRHVEDHGGDASVCIATTNAFGDVWKPLENLEDEDIDEALQKVSECIAFQESDLDVDPLVTVPTPDFGTDVDIASRFRFLRTYTAGGMGTVSVAADTQVADREVAFKEIRDKYADDPLSRQRFRVEAEITGGLEHPNIVPVYGLGADKTGRPFYAMRFIHGESLKDAIRDYYKDRDSVTWVREDEGETTSSSQRNRYRFRRLLEKFIDVCEALHYAHCRGVLHRDLKPGNVMLGRYNEVLVVDWGLAISQPRGEEVKDETDEPTLVAPSADDKTGPKKGQPEGTPAYMAPEQAAGRVDLFGKQTDVYALGATLYCILTGMPPFATDSELKTTLSKVEAGDFAQPTAVGNDVPEPLEAICLRAMATRPRDRYPSADELAKDVQRWLDDEAVSAWKEPITAKAFRWMRHHQKTVTGLGAAIAVGLLASVVLLRFVDQARRNEVALKDEAIRNYQVARKAVDRFYTEVAEEGLLSQPGMETKRRELLKEAQAAYAAFVKQYGPNSQEEWARTSYRLGVIAEELGDNDQAVELYVNTLNKQITLSANREAVDLDSVAAVLSRLAQRQPEENAQIAGPRRANDDTQSDPEEARQPITEQPIRSPELGTMFDFADSLNALGRALNSRNNEGDRDEAIQLLEESLALRRQLAAGSDETRSNRKLANALMNLSVIYGKADRKAQSIDLLRQSNSLREKFSFTDYKWRRSQAKGLLNEVRVLAQQMNQVDGSSSDDKARIKQDAENKARRAIQIAHGLLMTNTEAEQLLINAYQYLAYLHFGQEGDPIVRQEVLDVRVASGRRLLAASPDVAENQVNLARALIDYGDFIYPNEDWTATAEKYQEAHDLLDSLDRSQNSFWRRDYSYCHKVLAKVTERGDANLPKALVHITEAIAGFEALVRESSAMPNDREHKDYQKELNDSRAFAKKINAKILKDKGELEQARIEIAAAIEDYERLVAKDPASPEKKWQLEDSRAILETLAPAKSVSD